MALLLLPLGLFVGAIVAGLVTCAVLLPVSKPARVVVLVLEAAVASNYSEWSLDLGYWPSKLAVLVLLVIPAAAFLLLIPTVQERGATARWGGGVRIVLPKIEDWEAPAHRADEDGTSVPEVEEQEATTRRRRDGGAAVRPLLGAQSLLLVVPAVAALVLGDMHGAVSVIAIVVGVALAVLALAPADRAWAPPAGRSGRYVVLALEAVVLAACVTGLPGPGAFVALAMPAVVVLALVIAALLWKAPDVSGRR
ncbi:hypothetical protein [Actinomadura harenae]|uniref:hypothetical protein n=1 Tax=Actinomadura harenae TaxID=2483351 RepID=UPI0011C4A550|nr:hypothetical protein [Actinomadura harenae]